jgi:hypothetical protein
VRPHEWCASPMSENVHMNDVPVTMTENVPHCKENIQWQNMLSSWANKIVSVLMNMRVQGKTFPFNSMVPDLNDQCDVHQTRI